MKPVGTVFRVTQAFVLAILVCGFVAGCGAGSDATPDPGLADFTTGPYGEIHGESLAFDAAGTGFHSASERLLLPQNISFTPLP